MSDIDPEKLEAALDIHGYGSRGENFGLILAAARAHLATLPRWKEVEVWRVEWASAAFIPCIEQFVTEGQAKRAAHERASLGRKCVTVTGPHKQRVPQ